MYSAEMFKRAEKLFHEERMSYCAIGRELGISNSTVRIWHLHDFSPGKMASNNRKRGYRILDEQTILEAGRLFRQGGMSWRAIGRELGIHHGTVVKWSAYDFMPDKMPGRIARGKHEQTVRPEGFPASRVKAYVYLLGIYLGDGTISITHRERCKRLRISQDQSYPGIVCEIMEAVAAVMPGSRVNKMARPGCWEIYSCSNHWPQLFPQHGPGRKHTRPIILVPWQVAFVQRYPKLLVRGLIHSDGCRYLHTVHTNRKGRRYAYTYVEYAFNNRSQDILNILEDALGQLGVRFKRTGDAQRSEGGRVIVSRRKDVEFLDTFIGPKT